MRSIIDFALETGAITEQVTVTAETPLLQSDVAIRKVVDAKDIEQLSFSGRNPIGVASLKAGVVGGSFNTRGFADLGNGGFNINGSRSDENNITVDGATAIRTRSSGAIIGIQNVDAHPGSPGPDGELHAGVRPQQRRPDPLRHQERQQPLQRQRVVLLPGRLAQRQQLVAQPQHQPDRKQRPGALRPEAVPATPSAGRFRSAG